MRHTLDFVLSIESALPKDTCKSIIKKFEEFEDDQVDRDTDYYSFKEMNIHEHGGFEDEIKVVKNSAEYLLKFYKKELGINFFPEEFDLEQFRVKRYDPNDKDVFNWHVDVGDYASAKRFMVCFFYLNDVEEGGETGFSWLNNDDDAVVCLPKEGNAVMFPPMWMYPHKGMMPKSGPKYILSTYAHYL